MARKKRATGEFSSAFDEELENVQTPEDDLQNETFPEPTNTVGEKIPNDEEQDSDTTSDNSNKFGLIRQNQQNATEMIPRTYKLRQDTVDGLESLVYRDKKRNKKIPGTKGFISDFVDNAIWQHFLQLGLISEEEANKHVKDYSKYPINIENFTDFMSGFEEDL